MVTYLEEPESLEQSVDRAREEECLYYQSSFKLDFADTAVGYEFRKEMDAASEEQKLANPSYEGSDLFVITGMHSCGQLQEHTDSYCQDKTPFFGPSLDCSFADFDVPKRRPTRRDRLDLSDLQSQLHTKHEFSQEPEGNSATLRCSRL